MMLTVPGRGHSAATLTVRRAWPSRWPMSRNMARADDEAQVIFGEWKAPKPYLRIVPQPR